MSTIHSRTGHRIGKRCSLLLSATLLAMTAMPVVAGEGKAGAAAAATATAKAGAATGSCSANFADYKMNVWANSAPPNVQADPTTQVYPPSDAYKVLGGGAIVHTLQGNAFLTGSYPDIVNGAPVGWMADGKHLGSGTQARITAYAITVYDPNNCWSVQVFQQSTTTPVAHPAITVTVGSGYVLTGGGAKATPQTAGGNGNFLYSSIPYASNGSVYNGWSVHSKDHGIGDFANITGYAIGIKPAVSGVNMPTSNVVAGKPSASLSNPAAYVTGYNNVLPGINCVLTGGGAHDNWGNGYGNLLTAIYPLGNTGWESFAQSYGVDNPAVLQAYAVCLN